MDELNSFESALQLILQSGGENMEPVINNLKGEIAKRRSFFGYELNEERLMCSQNGALDKLRVHNWQEERVYVFIFDNFLA